MNQLRQGAASFVAVATVLLLLSSCSGSAHHMSRAHSSSPPPNQPPVAVPVFVQSHAGSAVSFQLPPGWHAKTTDRQSVTYAAPDGLATVSVSWAQDTLGTTLASLVTETKLATARKASKALEYACVTGPSSESLSAGRISVSFENPCGHPGAASVWLPASAPVRPAPTGGRTLSTATWIGTVTQEAWTILYTAPEARADPAVQQAVQTASLQQLARMSRTGRAAVGVSPPIVAARPPTAWQSPSVVASPNAAAPGASATDACRLVAPSDAAGVAHMPPFGAMTHLPPSGTTTSTCDETYADPETLMATGPPFGGNVEVSLVSTPLSAAGGTGTVGSSHGIATFSTLVESADPADFDVAVLLAAGPATSVQLVFNGPTSDISAWEQHVLATIAAHVAERLATGKLAATVTTPRSQRGAVATGMQYGHANIQASGSAMCAFIPDLSRLTHLTMQPNTAYPPSCDSTAQVVMFYRLSISLRGDASLAQQIARKDMLTPGAAAGQDVFTNIVNGVTVLVSVYAPDSEDAGEANAAIAVDQDQSVEVSVAFATPSDRSAAVALRDKVVAAATKAAA